MTAPLDRLWQALQALERQQRRPPPLGVVRDGGWFDEWQTRLDRVQHVRAALSMSGPTALRIITERLPGIELGAIGQVLLSACKDVAAVAGGSALLGGAAGAALGSLAGGVGAIPGGLAGAGVGLQAATWVMGVLGLKELVQDLAEAVPQALRHYERGIRMAWGPVKAWEMPERPEQAQYELAEGHIVLLGAILAALAAYLTRGRGDPAARARILQEIRQSPRLGPQVADWVAANEDKLIAHPGLRPRTQQVTMASSPAQDVGPPVTPAQLKRLSEEAMPSTTKAADPPKRPAGAPASKVMQQKRVPCFEPNDLPKSKYKEFDRQLEGQERGLNEMTVDEYLKGREAFDPENRDAAVARKARAQYQKKLATKLTDDLLREGKSSPKIAKAQGAAMAAKKMKTLAALHNPDLYAGGKDVIADFGDRRVNSRLGAQWKTRDRVTELDEAARSIPPADRINTKMNVALERCK